MDTKKILKISVGPDGDQVMLHWPNGQVEFLHIQNAVDVLRISWDLLKIGWKHWRELQLEVVKTGTD
jgi:hypothetical protein